jgi:hypothetical protein
MGKKKRQTFGKHARERAIEEKRRLKRERKQAAAAERQAAPDAEQTDTIIPLADGELASPAKEATAGETPHLLE